MPMVTRPFGRQQDQMRLPGVIRHSAEVALGNVDQGRRVIPRKTDTGCQLNVRPVGRACANNLMAKDIDIQDVATRWSRKVVDRRRQRIVFERGSLILAGCGSGAPTVGMNADGSTVSLPDDRAARVAAFGIDTDSQGRISLA